MPAFCRHNRLVQNCPICSKEQQVEMRAVLSSAAPAGARREGQGEGRRAATSRSGGRSSRSPGLVVRQMARGADDGYGSPLVPGLRSSVEAERLAEELAFAATRLALLETDPPGLYAEVATGFGGDVEERTWLAFLTALIGPLEEGDPFAAIAAAAAPATWASGAPPALGPDTPTGPRSSLDSEQPLRTIEAYRAWVARAGSQASAYTGEPSWTPERRFARIFERLGTLGGLQRDARFDLLVTLGRLGVYDLRAGALQVGGENGVTVGAKRALGIGDSLLLERRAAELAEATGVGLEALDLGFFNWERGSRTHGGTAPDLAPREDLLEQARAALGLG